MLHSLSIRNLATIESLEVVFSSGLNVLTGETGAGKSILVGALGLVLGARASSEAIRPGHKLASVEAAFNPRTSAVLRELFSDDLSLDWEPGEPLVLRREIARSGRNRCFVDGQMIGVADFRRIGEVLVDFHGQHEHQSLFHLSAARTALDAFAGHDRILDDHEMAWRKLADLNQRRLELDSSARDFQKRSDYVQFQLDEFEQVNPEMDELHKLEQKELKLANADSLSRSAAEAYEILYEGGGDSRPSLTHLTREVGKRLEEIAQSDDRFNPALLQLAEQRVLLEDLAYQLRDYAASIESSPDCLDSVISRLESIRRLIHKHGGTEEEMFRTIRDMKGEIEQRVKDDRERMALENEIENATAHLGESSGKLSAGRKKHAALLDRQVVRCLRELNMEQARFTTHISPLSEPGSKGMDKVEFLLAANPGLPSAPLQKIGSGGEISRVMLSLKSVLASRDMIPTLVFDEIDVGLSGETAVRVGKAMETLSGSHQVLCITHHAPIAARAENHLSVRKITRGENTFTETCVLAGNERLEEIARMMGGEATTAAGLELARQLMD
jgi:DNA repair protein RecN (Recombination protein N)